MANREKLTLTTHQIRSSNEIHFKKNDVTLAQGTYRATL